MNLVTIKNVRGYVDENSKIAYLNLEDVARGLGFTEVAKSGNEVIRWRTVRKYLLDLDVIATSCDGQGKENLPKFIPENVFYKLCMKANNEIARKFQDLVCDEILPSIRQNGGYIVSNENDSDEDIMARALLIAQRTIEKKNQKIKLLETKVEEDKPKVEYHDSVLHSDKLLTMTEISKDLGMSAIKLNKVLNELHIQYKKGKCWCLYAEYENLVPSHFDYHISEYGQVLKATELGRKWLIEKLKENEII